MNVSFYNIISNLKKVNNTYYFLISNKQLTADLLDLNSLSKALSRWNYVEDTKAVESILAVVSG